MAEKVETILRRSVFITRPRDYYDVYILHSTQTYDKSVFSAALSATTAHRGTTEQIGDFLKSLKIIAESAVLKNQWDVYCMQFNYARGISFSMIINVLSELLN